MRKIETGLIYETLYNIIRRSVCNVEPGVVEALSSAVCAESCEAAKFALRTIIESDNIAAKEDIPACQDTGMAVIFADIGQEVCLEGEYFEKVINDAVRDAYRDGYFRCSVLTPLERQHPCNNTYENSSGRQIDPFLPCQRLRKRKYEQTLYAHTGTGYRRDKGEGKGNRKGSGR